MSKKLRIEIQETEQEKDDKVFLLIDSSYFDGKVEVVQTEKFELVNSFEKMNILQFQNLVKIKKQENHLRKLISIISVLSGAPYELIKQASSESITDVIKNLDQILNLPDYDFVETIYIKHKGFHFDKKVFLDKELLNKMSDEEWLIDNLHYVLSIAYKSVDRVKKENIFLYFGKKLFNWKYKRKFKITTKNENNLEFMLKYFPMNYAIGFFKLLKVTNQLMKK